MAKRKTACSYAAAITELHHQRLEYPDSDAIIRKIDTPLFEPLAMRHNEV